MKHNGESLKLASYEDLFKNEETRQEEQQERVQMIATAEMDDFPNHPFQVCNDEKMRDTIESIQENGVLVPAIVRPKENGRYEIVSGHRRRYACMAAGIAEMPAIVRDMTDDEAIIIMVDSNLQRETILPSEKAFAYKMKLDAMRRQAGRPSKNNSVPVGQNFGQTSREVLASNSPDSNTQIQRYIRLTNLTPELLDMVDNSVLKEKDKLQMALRPAVELSYLSKDEQTTLLEIMESEDCTPSHDQAIRIRDLSEKGMLTPKAIQSIMQEEKPNQVEQFKIPRNRIDKFFPAGTPAQKIEDTIVRALEMYRKRERARER